MNHSTELDCEPALSTTLTECYKNGIDRFYDPLPNPPATPPLHRRKALRGFFCAALFFAFVRSIDRNATQLVLGIFSGREAGTPLNRCRHCGKSLLSCIWAMKALMAHRLSAL